MNSLNLKYISELRLTLAIVIVVLCSKIILAQQNHKPYLLHWIEKDGLCDNYVSCIEKDNKGYLWIGTSNGLCRFDGNDFRPYRFNPKDENSIGADNIRALLKVSNGQIWVGASGGGLNVYDYKNDNFRRLRQDLKNPNQGLVGDRVHSIAERDSHNFIIGYNAIGSGKGGLTIVSEDLKIKKHVLQEEVNKDGFPVQAIRMYKDSKRKDDYWFGGRSLYKWNFETNQLFDFPHSGFSLDRTLLTDFVEHSDTILLVGFQSDGLWSFDKKKGQWKKKILNQSIHSITKDKQGKIWIADAMGVGWLNVEKQMVNYELLLKGKESPFVENTKVNQLVFIDGNMWICTTKGLYCWNSIFQQFNINTIKYPEQGNVFYAEFVGEIDDNDWAFADRNKGLVVTDSFLQIKRVIPIPNLVVRKAKLIQHKGQKIIFLCGDFGLYKWNVDESIIKPFLPANVEVNTNDLQVWSFFYEKEDLWIGTRFNGLLKIDLNTNVATQYLHDPNDSLSLCHDHYLFEIDKDEKGNLWIATDKGISIMDPARGVFVKYPNLEKLENFIVHAIELDDKGRVLIGTRNQGLFRYNLNTHEVHNFTTDDGLLYNGVNQLQRDDTVVWMVTRTGLCKLNSNTNQIIGFNQNKGMPIAELYGSRIAMLPDNSIYLSFVFSDFYSKFKGDQIKDYFQPPDLNITMLRELTAEKNKHLIFENGKNIQLKADENYFSIDYKAIHFFQPHGLEYEYKLEGYDQDCIKAGQFNSATYTNLPGGDYLFKVKAANKDGAWSEVQTLSIFLATPWYETTLFYILIGLFLVALVYAFYKNRMSQIRKEENFKRQLAETEMKALRSQINPHFIFNCLNSIKGYIIDNRIEDGTEYVGRFAQLIRMVLNHSKEKLIPISREIEAIKHYVWLEQERLNHKFNVEFELSFENDADSFKIPPLLFQPYIENAIWHGLMNLDRSGNLKIKIKEFSDNILIQILDDGIGRKRSAAIKSKSVFTKPSMGLEISAGRLEQINELYHLKSEIIIEDQYPERFEPGTKVSITFPKIKTNVYAQSNFS